MKIEIRGSRFGFTSLQALNCARKLCFSTLLFLFAAAVWLVAAAPASAQVGLSNAHPNLARGSGKDKTCERYEWDIINLLNGNLNLSIPFGAIYPITSNFDYQFALSYNSNVWDLDQPSGAITAAPIKNANAGFGWDISFGRLIPPVVNGAQVGRWIYVSPDGASHPFYSTLHFDVSENDPGDNYMYTRDETYYRMVIVSSTQIFVEAPDGTQSLFQLTNGEWKLVQIGDRFNNRIWFNYSTPNAWVITDNRGRAHTIYFKADPAGYYPAIVDRIILAAFNGTTATYTFNYASASVTRPGIDNDPATSQTINLSLLTSITAPDGSQYVFTYNPVGAVADSSGRLASMRLPTLGKIEWTYRFYPYTTSGNPTSLGSIFRQTTGVASRRLIDNSGGVVGTWAYTPSLRPAGTEEREMINTVQTPLGNKSVYYFSVNTTANGPEWNKSDYALPYTKNEFDRPRNPSLNVSLASNGATASADSTVNNSYPASATINGDRKGLNWGNGGGWNDGTTNWFPDWLQVSFSGSKTIDRINVFTIQDNFSNPVEPTADMTFSQYGIQNFDVQYWNGTGWVTVPGGSVVGNNKVWRQFLFAPLTTSKIRVLINKANMSSRIVEVEAFESSLPADTRFLSKQVLNCDEAGNNCQLLRSTYARYEQDQATDPASPEVANTNRREASTRLLYHDDVENGVARFADTDRSNFDGLGHYRQMTTNGNFGSGDVRTIFQNYDAATGSYPSAGYLMPTTTSSWILTTTGLQKITEGTSAQIIEFCYDRNNGFLKRTRRWSTTLPSGTASSNDVVTVFTPDAVGQVTTEQYYGGDVQPIGTGPLCTLAIPATDQYRVQHTYQHGARSSTQFYTGSGTPFGPKYLDQTIDRNTGMVAISRDVAGIATSYEYDGMERQIWIKPQAGHAAWTKYEYFIATSHTWNGKRKHTTTYSNGGSTILTAKMDVLDGFGQLWAEQELMPGQVWATRYKLFNALGWITHKSEYSTDSPRFTEYLNYDPFGRPRIIRTPDGPQHDVTYQYAGDRSTIRTAMVGLMYYPYSGQVIEGPRSKTQIFDRQGRLWKEISQTSHGSPSFVKVNSYDAAGRLNLSTDARGNLIGSQQYYDGRGFMYWSRYATGNNAVYQNFDAQGNSLKQRFTLTDLNYTFDRAGRLTSVSETNNPGKMWKEFTYADSNGTNDWRAGKLWTTKRYHYLNNLGPVGGVAVVSETFSYGGKNGRLSSYDVSLSDSLGLRERFSQSYAYTELGNIEQINYPNSTFAGSGNMGRVRSVASNFVTGRLYSVTGTLNSLSEPWASSISYHGNGLVSQVAHSNGVTDNFTNDPNGVVRVASIFTTGVQKQSWQTDQNFYSGDFQYDGDQNLVRIGTKYFIPQDGQPPPEPVEPPKFTMPCEGRWIDPFGIPQGMMPDSSCYPMVLSYYTATDSLFKIEDRSENKKTWFFYDGAGRKLTEYNVVLYNGAWLSTRDYIYRDNTLLAIEETLNGVANPKVYHFHLGFGIPGIQTDSNGFRTSPAN